MSSKNMTMKQAARKSEKRSREGSHSNRRALEEPKTPQMKKVGQFLIDMDRQLGQGQYGKVYLS